MIPPNVIGAARRAGLGLPLWYVGPRHDPHHRRKKTLADLVREAEKVAAQDQAGGDSNS